MFLTILIFLIILLVLVLAHEFGHFLFAKLAGVKVEEFAFGFPPRIFSVTKGETRYSFNLLPLGGFVKIQGEEGEDSYDPRSFAAQRFWTKVIIIAAGVVFNLLLAYLLFSLVFMIGSSDAKVTIQITEVQVGSPAEQVGIMPGDKIVSFSFEGKTFETNIINEVKNYIEEHRGKEIVIRYDRLGEIKESTVIPRAQVKEGEGALGIGMARTEFPKLSFLASLKEGFFVTIALTQETVRALYGFFGEVFTGKSNFEQVSGPVGIVRIVDDFSRMGFVFLLQLTALLSINLALINIIPFPGLDGGRIFFIALEKIKGSPFHWKFTRAVHAAGFALLILLMIFITYHDIIKFNS